MNDGMYPAHLEWPIALLQHKMVIKTQMAVHVTAQDTLTIKLADYYLYPLLDAELFEFLESWVIYMYLQI